MQTRDGYLWFGTYSGLARFDGERFQVFDSSNTPKLQDRRISSLFEDSQGILWIGQESGTINRYRMGQFERFPVATGSREKVLALGSDQRGHIWAMRHSGSVESLSSNETIPSPIAPDLPSVMAWSRSGRGDIWLAENGHAALLTADKLSPITLPVPVRDNYVLNIAATADGGAWILCDGRIRKWSDGRWMEDRGEFPWPEGPIACSLEMHDGTLAVGTIYSGLFLVFGDGRRPVRLDSRNGLPQNWIRFLLEDQEGTLWAGTGSAGLVSIHPSPAAVLAPPDQWQGCSVLSVSSGRHDSLWVGTDGGGLYNYAVGKWQHFSEAEGLLNPYVPAVSESPTGEVWAGNFWWGGPSRLASGRFVRSSLPKEESSPIFALSTSGREGEILVGNCDGLLQVDRHGSKWLAQSPTPSAGGVCAVVVDSSGTIWGGFAQAGVVRISAGKTQHFGQKDGLATDAVQCLAADENGAIWIGTADKGICRFKDGRFANLNVSHGLVDNAIGYILDDGRGHFWLSSHHGLQRVPKEALNWCADGLIPSIPGKVFDHSDGLPTSEFTGGLQAAGCRTLDGRLWFASSKGLVCIDSARIENNARPPPVMLQALFVDGQSTPFGDGAVPQPLPPDHRRLEFRFSGLSFVAPNKVLFKYRLDGIDQSWVEAGTKRAAFYSRLPAGTYRFRVIACNNDGVWNTEGSTLAFSVDPFFWQTWWFVGACLLAAAAAIASFARHIIRRRMQREIERMERQHEIERERSRIAQDIHDDVGASLSRIAMLSQPAGGVLSAPEHTTAMLSRIYTTARDLTRSLDEIVWAIDPKHDTLDSIADYMGKYAYEYLALANVRCRLTLPIEVPAWPLTAEARHNLFLAFKEALNNAVKHSAGNEVRITLLLHAEAFELRVQDNGHGFDPTLSAVSPAVGRAASGNGLGNMRSRISGIGGRCEISSRIGEGTTVSFTVVTSRRPSPSSLARPLF
ncbi:MAG: ATP-binding protein [Opitutaceae bacterium]|nr:ATP-binding protein [Opitutaceae bacterium]